MTITGASINAKLLSLIKPEVVIVEEAGEVLEPQILAAAWPSHGHAWCMLYGLSLPNTLS